MSNGNNHYQTLSSKYTYNANHQYQSNHRINRFSSSTHTNTSHRNSSSLNDDQNHNHYSLSTPQKLPPATSTTQTTTLPVQVSSANPTSTMAPVNDTVMTTSALSLRGRRGRQARPSQLSTSMHKAVRRFCRRVGAPNVVPPAGFRDFRGWLIRLNSYDCRSFWDQLIAAIARETSCDLQTIHQLKEDIVREIVKCVVIPRPDESAKLVSTNAGRQASTPRSGTTLMVVLNQQLHRTQGKIQQLVSQFYPPRSSSSSEDNTKHSSSSSPQLFNTSNGSSSTYNAGIITSSTNGSSNPIEDHDIKNARNNYQFNQYSSRRRSTSSAPLQYYLPQHDYHRQHHHQHQHHQIYQQQEQEQEQHQLPNRDCQSGSSRLPSVHDLLVSDRPSPSPRSLPSFEELDASLRRSRSSKQVAR